MIDHLGPVAVIGTACRFPGGATSPEAFWNILVNGRDVVSELPAERFDKRLFQHPDPAVPDRSYTFAAGTLGDVSGFDAGFFGISPREAEQMDPQQRLLLEMTWEAMERGGQVPDHIAGTQTAVYVGISSTDYADIRQGDPGGGNAYFMLGSTLSIAANRISYIFDLHGPSMAIDTACSSSLVALHEAVRALSDGRCGMAVVGGMHLLLSPYNFIGFSKASMLSPYGRCRAFDKVAQGYVRAEGGGVVLLKPLADAERDGDPILGIIRGVGLNSDGRTNGIALPSSPSQEALLRQVYRESGVEPDAVVYFEAHGTGTAVGDPAETGAIGRAVAVARKTGPLPIGSVKTNIGHLEPAAGMAGLIKSLLILKHRQIPPTLHIADLNPDLQFDTLNLTAVREAMPLPATEQPAVIGVNSFGFGGTNAHVVLEEYRATVSATAAEGHPETVPAFYLSARNDAALRSMAGAMAEALAQPEAPSLEDAAWTLARRRTHHDARVVVRGEDPLAGLRAFATGAVPEGTTSGVVVSRAAPLALLFAGNGCQYTGMGAMLLKEEPIFRATVEQIDALIQKAAGWSVLAEMAADAPAEHMQDTCIAQPVLFAFQAGVVEALRARGIRFGAVVGHSVGEVAAAWAAGALSLEQAVHVILERSAAQGRTRGQGRMAATDLDAAAAQAAVAPYGGRIEVAALNSPKAVTLSGAEEALRELGDVLADGGTPFRMLDLDYAFHNRVLDPVHEDLIAALGDVVPATAPTEEPVRFFSTVTGDEVAFGQLNAAYWWDNVRQPVRFHQAISALAEAGFQLFMEVSPHPIMQAYVRQTLRALDAPGQPLNTLTRQRPGGGALTTAVDRAHTLGAALDFEALFPGRRPVADLPTYPWQRESYWFQPTPEARGPVFQRVEKPLLGARPLPGAMVWEQRIDTQIFPYLADHTVGGSVVFPAAGFLEMALEAGRLLFDDARADVEHLEIRRPLVLEPGRSKAVRFVYDEATGIFTIASRTVMHDEAWSVHVTGRLAEPEREAPDAPVDLTVPGPVDTYDAETHYAFARALGLEYGPAFQAVRSVAVDGQEAIAELVIPEAVAGQSDLSDYSLHPSLFDGCLQALFNILRQRTAAGTVPTAYLPYQIGRVLHHGRDGLPSRCRISLRAVGPRSLVADFVLTDEDGVILAEARRFRFQRADLLRRKGAAGVLHGIEEKPLPTLVAVGAAPLALAPAIAAAEESAATAQGPDAALAAIAGAFAAEALRALKAPERFTLDALAEAAGVPPVRLDLLYACCVAAVEAGLLNVDEAGEIWSWESGAVDAPPADAVWRAALGRHPDHLAELTLLGRAGRALSGALRDADVRIVPTAATLDHFFDGSPTMAGGASALAAAVCAALADRPAHRHLRVLEVGAGTGSLTRRLLAGLPVDGVSLVASDVDEEALSHLAGELGQRPNMTVETLDILAPLADQAVAAQGPYDIVVAAGLLHSVETPVAALEAMAALAGPDGLVLVAEPAPAAWMDIAFGCDAGWWSRHAADIPLPPLLDADVLADLSAVSGLTDAATLTVGGALLLAARSAHAPMELGASAETEKTTPLWWLVADPKGAEAALAEATASALEAAGAAVRWMDPASLDMAAPEAWASVLAEGQAPTGVLHLLGALDRPVMGQEIIALQDRRLWTTAAFVQGLGQADLKTPPRLVLVTHAAGLGDVGQAPLWGLGRVLQNEQPDVHCRLIDLRGLDAAALAPVLAADVLADGPEAEVALGVDHRLGLRVRPSRLPPGGAVETAEQQRRSLSFTPGSLDNLYWTDEPRRAPGAGEVEIAVRATGLNFRDVMFAMGVLPDEAVENGFAGATIGMEASGVVVRVGEGVTGLREGDEVLCFAPACFSSHITTATTAVAPKPEGLTFSAAATVPTVFFTVYYALHHLARLEPGERVLIHGGAGGVGLAAIQYARHVGAEVFTTVGTAEKRALVALSGVPEDHILDSRSTAFADQILALTGGEGVDVVLNSLAGEAIHKSLMCLRPFGRFLELGKRDFFANSHVGLRPFRNNLTYFGIDADQLMVEKPALAARLFREMTGLFNQGVFQPLPYRVFSPDRAVEAFRHMQQSRHVGKIVLTPPQAPQPVVAADRPASLSLDPKAAYLVTGGLGGFGLETARWLAEKGARNLILVSRRGGVDAASRPVIDALEARGVTVRPQACDVADAAAVDAMIAAVTDAGHPPLKGIVHAAAVYDDGILSGLTAKRFAKVLAPKVAGGWNLHRATLGMALDLFVVYSSVTTLLGNPGQANYVAANQALEALIAHRRIAGLSGLAVCWGAIADAGYLARNADVQETLADRLGAAALTSAQALDWLERLLLADVGNVTVAELDWRTLRSGLPAMRSPRFLEVAGGSVAGDGDGGADIKALISGLSALEVRDLITEMLTEQIGQVLRMPADRINPRQSIFEMGMDSLMALELKMLIEERFGVDLPPMAISEGATVVVLAERIRDYLIDEPAEEDADHEVAALISRHAEIGLDVREIVDGLESENLGLGAKLIS